MFVEVGPEKDAEERREIDADGEANGEGKDFQV